MNKQYDQALKKLAKSDYYQSLYNCAKEINVQLFKNVYDFSRLQLMFVSYLAYYSNIFMDIAIGDCSDRVLDNEIYEEAYSYYRRESLGKEAKKKFNSIKLPKQKKDDNTVITPKSTWVFKRKRKE